MNHILKKLLLLCLLMISCVNINPESESVVNYPEFDLQHIAPPHWWVGFKNQRLQLMVHGERIGEYNPEIQYPGVSIEKVHRGQSQNYLFIDLKIDKKTSAGEFSILFKKEDDVKTIKYELKAREIAPEEYKGFDSSDAIYLITPDRFSNANLENDSFKFLNETGIDRNHDYKRHGGDLEGITNHLDYIENMGFTAIWPTPVLLNNMSESSYHGYAITDYYQVDPRFGTLEEYSELSKQLRTRGMKLIMDQVANHCGLAHWWMNDLPFEDWVNDQKNFEENSARWNWKHTHTSNHRRTTNQDLYASKKDSEGMSRGWFVPTMPDLNQQNPFMAKYLIQNSIWWIETLHLGGIRQDTYPYPDKEFMSAWAKAIMNEYPHFSIVGEEWSYNPLLVAYWQQGHQNKDGYQSNLKSSMDFPMQKAIIDALNEEETWGTGLVKLYEDLANDFAYASPKDLLVFLDNHDMSRVHTQLNLDIVKTKMALGYLLTLPRIPQIYYGTEILMNDREKPGDHGLIRSDFPGGWKGDPVSAFSGKGLNPEQKEMQDFLKKILNYRKSSPAIHRGKTIHFAPQDGVYVLFRVFEDETLAVFINKNKKEKKLALNRFEEMGLAGKTMKNIVSGEEIVWHDHLTFNENGIFIYKKL